MHAPFTKKKEQDAHDHFLTPSGIEEVDSHTFVEARYQ